MAEETPGITGENRDDKGRFVPGVSGNPAGRPPGTFSLLGMLRNALQEVPETEQRTYAELLIKRMLKQGIIDGNPQTQKLIWNYLEGLPKATIGFEVDKENLSQLTEFFKTMANGSSGPKSV